MRLPRIPPSIAWSSPIVAVALLSACSLLAPSDEELVGGNAGGSSASTSTSASSGGGSGMTTGSGSGGSSSTGGGAPIPTDAMLLWLSADTGVVVQSGRVASWQDRSGNKSDATQAVLNAQPVVAESALNGLPAIDFDGVDDYLSLPPGFSDFSQGLSLFSVVQRRAMDTEACPPILQLSNGSEVDDISLQRETSDKLLYEVLGDTVSSNSSAYPEGVPKLLSVIHSPTAAAELTIDGQLSASFDIPLPVTTVRSQNFIANGLYGGCTPHGGLIAEVILYARALASSEQSAVREYLQAKWGCCQ